MLVCQNKFNKRESKYECDRCKEKLKLENRYSIYIKAGIENTRKKWDLCYRCYRALARGIEKNS